MKFVWFVVYNIKELFLLVENEANRQVQQKKIDNYNLDVVYIENIECNHKLQQDLEYRQLRD